MDWSVIAASKVNDLTRTRASGAPVNTHVVSPARKIQPDYDQMKRLVHGGKDPPLDTHKQEK